MTQGKKPRRPALEFCSYCLLILLGGFFFIDGCSDGTVYRFGRNRSGEASYQNERVDYLTSMAFWGVLVIGGGGGIYQSRDIFRR